MDNDLPLTYQEKIEQAYASLKTEKERNFFDNNYLLEANPHIVPALKPRSETDSLVGALKDFMVLKNYENPFVLDWIEELGYPVWRESYLKQEHGNSGTMVVVTPFAKINESHTSGFMLGLPHYWTAPQFYVDITDRESIDAHVLAGLPDTLSYAFKVAVSLDFDTLLFGHVEPSWRNWLKNLIENSLGGLKTDVVSERYGVNLLTHCIQMGYALTENKVEERNPCPEGQYPTLYAGSTNCEPSPWHNFNQINPNNNTGGSGGSIFSNDFTSDIFTSNNFYYQMSECPFSNEDPPLIYATSGSSANWAGQFMNAANYFLEQTLNSGSTTFNEAFAINYNNTPNSQFNHIPYGNSYPQTIEALSKVFEKMEMKYNACNNQYPMGGEGGGLFNPALCTCLGNYSVEDGLDDFFMNLYGLNTEDFVELFGVVMELKEQLELDVDQVNFLMQNSGVAIQIEAFLESHQYLGAPAAEVNLSNAVARAFLLYFIDTGQTNLELWDIPAPSDPLWNIMKEQLLEMIKGLVADFVPGGTLLTIGPDLFDNLQQGNWMDAMYNAADIVLNEADAFLPAAKVASFGYGLFVNGKQLKKVYEAFKQAKALREDYLVKLYNVFRNRLNWGVTTIRENFQWLGSNQGAKLDNVTSSQFFQKLKDEFNVGNASPAFLDFNNNPVFKIATITQANLAIYMVLYPDSSSGYNWTVGFYTGPINAQSFGQLAVQFKIRLEN